MAKFYDVYNLISEDDVYVRLSDKVVEYLASNFGMRGFGEDAYEYLDYCNISITPGEYYDFVGLCIALDEYSEEHNGNTLSNYFWDKRIVAEIVRVNDGIGLYIEA